MTADTYQTVIEVPRHSTSIVPIYFPPSSYYTSIHPQHAAGAAGAAGAANLQDNSSNNMVIGDMTSSMNLLNEENRFLHLMQ